MSSLRNIANIAAAELEQTAADIRQYEQVLALDPIDAASQEWLAGELAVMRRRLETIVRAIHEERRMAR